MATQPQGILGRPRFGPSDSLAIMFRACTRDPTEAISKRLRSMLHIFMQHHRDNAGNENSMTKELAVKCCCGTEALYYRILEAIVNQEKKRLGINDISGILEPDLFQRGLVVCCLEITIISHQLPGGFPLLLHIFSLAPYHFYKVIELVLRTDEGLPPAVVRHLSQVEDKVLESLAWTRDSPLWHSIRAIQGPLPACQQVVLPKHLEDPNSMDRNSTHENIASGNPRRGVSSNRYSTPPAGSQMTLALSRAGPVRQAHTSSILLPGQTVVTMAAATVSTNSGLKLIIPVQLCLNLVAVNRRQRTDSLSIFLRKVYDLMSRRLRELCSRLDISDELRLKIWACFEHSLVHCTDLMLDRHLDQLLMCAIYIMAKTTQVDMPFMRIMKCYKSQPHTSNSVCNSTLISGRGTENVPAGNNNNGGHRESFPTPDTPSTHYPGHGSGSQNAPREERGNLIYFYNQVYTQLMQFSTTHAIAGWNTPLTPFPREWKGSPRRHRPFSNHSLYISLHNRETPPSTSHHTSGLCYYFNRSPSTHLREINSMIKTGNSPNKRSLAVLLGEENEEGNGHDGADGPPVKRLRQVWQSAWQRRLRNVVSERVRCRNQDQHQPPPITKPNLH